MSDGPREEDVRAWDEHQVAHGGLTQREIEFGLARRHNTQEDESWDG